jgi:hypothetical protein
VSILELLQQDSESAIFNQLLEILGIIVRHDFPAQWGEFHKFLISTLSTLHSLLTNNETCSKITNFTPALYKELDRFFKIYSKMLEEQMKKKMQTKKTSFLKMAPELLEHTFKIWKLLNTSLTEIFSSPSHCPESEESKKPAPSQPSLPPDAEGITKLPEIFSLAHYEENILLCSIKLDKLLLKTLICGFNSHELMVGDKGTAFIVLVHLFLNKLTFYMHIVEQLYTLTQQPSLPPSTTHQIQAVFHIICKVLKSLLFKLSDLQYSEPVVFYKHLGFFLNIIQKIVAVSNVFPEELIKVCVISLYRVLNTVVYSENEIKNSLTCKYTGILASPVKFRNFEKFLIEARNAYYEFFNEENVIYLFDLMVSNYLLINLLPLWRENPESFIELEDDVFSNEFDLDIENSLNYLTYIMLEQMTFNFTPYCLKQIQKYVLTMIENKNSTNLLIKDSILNSIEILPKIYKIKKTSGSEILNINLLLSFIEGELTATSTSDNDILKRRYILLISKWIEYIDSKVQVFFYFTFV